MVKQTMEEEKHFLMGFSEQPYLPAVLSEDAPGDKKKRRELTHEIGPTFCFFHCLKWVDPGSMNSPRRMHLQMKMITNRTTRMQMTMRVM